MSKLNETIPPGVRHVENARRSDTDAPPSCIKYSHISF